MLTLAGCSGEEETLREASADGLTLGLVQIIPEEGTRRVMLRVTNDRPQDLHVTDVGLAWPGYGSAFLRTQDAVVPAGRTLDLRFSLPDPTCTPTTATAVGQVRTEDADLRVPLKDISQDYLRRLWQGQCDHRLVRDTVTVGYRGGWRQEGIGAEGWAQGRLVVERRAEAAPDVVALKQATGSVLYELELDPVTLSPRQASARTTLRILPTGRCDEHARGQATAPFDFELVAVVGERRVLVPLPVPTAATVAATRMLDRVCGPILAADQRGRQPVRAEK